MDTDAPLRSPIGSTLLDPPPLFDSIRIDLYAPGDADPCTGCSRIFSVDRSQFESIMTSVGVTPREGRDGYRLRARLFNVASLRDGEPHPRSTIDVTIALPSIDEGEVVDVSLFFPTDNVAEPLGSASSPLPAVLGKPSASRVGTWWGAERTDCPTEPGVEQLCIPGGAYWMGAFERLVVLSPFLLDKAEVTVAAVRAWSSSGVIEGVGNWSGKLTGSSPEDFCTYGANDALPINCITWARARQYCLDRGGDLPSEAQLEYVMSRLGWAPYPWGSTAPRCEDAVYGRGGGAQTALDPAGVVTADVSEGPCVPEKSVGGVLPAGSGARDKLELSGGSVLDLAANVSEWALDRWEEGGAACWPTGVLVDPLCGWMNGGETASVRGGSWGDSDLPPAPIRKSLGVIYVTATTGFRCRAN